MRELILDASAWKSYDDMFSSFFEAVGAPHWHGRNFNALRDSVGVGDINEIEVPYRLVFKNYSEVDPMVKVESDHFIEVIRDLAKNGVPVEIRLEA